MVHHKSPPPERFWASVDKRGSGECWPWRASKRNGIYGQIKVDKKSMLAHRYSYLLHHGSLTDGLVIDHICRNKLCVNPAHLREVTIYVNGRENSVSPAALNVHKTHCMHGHPFSGPNLVIRKGFRQCLTCERAHTKRHRLKKRAIEEHLA